MKTIDYCKAAKKKLGITSDYALAKELKLTRSAISFLVNGHCAMSTTTAAKIAEILELDEIKVIADVELERGTNDELWKRIAKKVATIALVAIGVQAAPSPTQAAPGAPAQAQSVPTVCIM